MSIYKASCIKVLSEVKSSTWSSWPAEPLLGEMSSEVHSISFPVASRELSSQLPQALVFSVVFFSSLFLPGDWLLLFYVNCFDLLYLWFYYKILMKVGLSTHQLTKIKQITVWTFGIQSHRKENLKSQKNREGSYLLLGYPHSKRMAWV